MELFHGIIIHVISPDDDIASMSRWEVMTDQLPKNSVPRVKINDKRHILQLFYQNGIVDPCVIPQSLVKTVHNKE